MKQFTRAVVSAALCAALSLACTLPAYAAEGEMLEVNEDISVSADYDWTRFANDHLTLNVYNWGLYISDGSDDSVNVISAFEDLTGIKVNYTACTILSIIKVWEMPRSFSSIARAAKISSAV